VPELRHFRESIQKTICDFYNIKIGDLKAKRRTRNIAFPRQVAMYLCRKATCYMELRLLFNARVKQETDMAIKLEQLSRAAFAVFAQL
jgi:hypothetical protein